MTQANTKESSSALERSRGTERVDINDRDEKNAVIRGHSELRAVCVGLPVPLGEQLPRGNSNKANHSLHSHHALSS